MNPYAPPITRTQQEQERRSPDRELFVLPVTPVTATTAAASQLLVTARDNAFMQVNFKVTNVSGAAVTFTLHEVPIGGTAGNGNIIYSAESIPANDTVTLSSLNSLLVDRSSEVRVHCSSASDLNIKAWGAHIIQGDPL